ncbi:MAG TPA: CBS domain-containing protein, partial [Bryobacterales bacterium]|nr:CBS domain-containing protein [Bryobacterales bacterium]
IACIIAHAFTVLVLRRSILTEKVSRRGYHLSCEYAVDPLEILFVREVMRTNIAALPADVKLDDLATSLRTSGGRGGQRLYPVVDKDHHLVGVVTRHNIQKALRQSSDGPGARMADLVNPSPVVAYPDEPLRLVVYRMAETGLTRFPVVERGGHGKLVGMIALKDLLQARVRNLQEERRRERVLRTRIPFVSRPRRGTEMDSISSASRM